MREEMERLLRGSGNANVAKQNRLLYNYRYSKDKIKKICRALSLDSITFQPKKVVDNIKTYLHSDKKLKRIFYSEISNYVFSLNYNEIATFSSNIDTLLDYVLKNEPEVEEEVLDFIIRLYDHCQLAFYQQENTQELFDENVESVKERLQVDVKKIEREYITILGIFASIVLAFVGGFTFSNSILRYISSVSIFRLVFVIDLLAVVLITVIYLLLQFIMRINENDDFCFHIRWLYFVTAVIASLDVVAWVLNANRIAGYVQTFLPWR